MVKKRVRSTTKATANPMQRELFFVDALGKDFTATLTTHKDGRITLGAFKPVKPSLKETVNNIYSAEGANKYLVACHKLGIYTSIGADNIHHASNKATKLFGPHWSFIRDTYHSKEFADFEFQSVANFNRVIKTLSN